MNKKTLVLLAMMAAGMMGGCDWSNPLYNEYVTEDGRVYFCPPKISSDSETKKVKIADLNTLFCYETYMEAKTEFAKKHPINNLDNCIDLNKRECKDIDGCEECDFYRMDYLACTDFRKQGLFDYEGIEVNDDKIQFIGLDTKVMNDNICPKDYPLCSFENGRFGCGKDNIVNECQCKIEDVPNSKTVACDQDSICIAKECNEGYHIKGGKCVIDSVVSCGNGEVDCTNNTGWQDGECSASKCIVANCKEHFHKIDESNIDRCEVDSEENCGSNKNKCDKVDGDGIDKIVCVDGVCAAFSCLKGYHKTQDEMKCEVDDYNHCGSYNNNCGLQAGWKDLCDKDTCGECVNQKCIVKECQKGYHVKDNECEQDTNEKCGTDLIDCSSKGMVCSQGECDKGCDNGMIACSDGCYNVSNDPNHCGNSCIKCSSYSHARPVCENNNCSLLCIDGYGDCDGKIENGCETDLKKYRLEYNSPGNCTCGKYSYNKPNCIYDCVRQASYHQCGTLDVEDENLSTYRIPLCIKNLDSYGLKGGAECGCSDKYIKCGEFYTKVDAFDKEIVLPSCIYKKDLNKFKLSENDCKCKERFTQCGTISFDGTRMVPLCLEEGSYYKNYNINGDSKEFRYVVNYHTDNAQFDVYYDYQSGKFDKYVKYNKYHFYKKISSGWNSKFMQWNESNCAKACNPIVYYENISAHEVGPYYKDSTRETWAHKCSPGDTCSQLDSFEQIDNGQNGKFYFDYGCQ